MATWRNPGRLAVAAIVVPLLFQFVDEAHAKLPHQPNILFFFVDDMGWQDTSVPFHSSVTQLNRRYHTPNMERLAGEGVKFTQAYACAVCSPSRVSLMTGLNTARHMVTNWTLRKDRQPDQKHPRVKAAAWNFNGMSPTPGVARTVYAVTLPMLLKHSGYRTIHCGKAHFGAQGTPGANPLNLGFDVNIAGHAAGGPGSYYGKYNFSAVWRHGDPIWDVPGLEKYHGQDINLTEALTREAIAAIERAVADDVPFYLYMAHYAIHAPWEKDDRFYQKYVDAGLKGLPATYASMIESMDKSLGDLMQSLQRLGVADNTVVVFMSDNGQPKQVPRNRPLRGHKLTPYEGGVRVPLIVKWPGVVKPGGVCRDHYVIIEDIFPTLLEMGGVEHAAQVGGKIDGVSFVPLLRGTEDYPRDRPIFWHFPNTYDQPPYSAVRKGDWKLIYHHVTRQLELFNLRSDLSERDDLSRREPEKTRELAKVLGDFLRDAKAKMTIDRATDQPVEYPDRITGWQAAFRPGAKVPDSAIAANLEWLGVAVSEPHYTIWGAAPIQDDDGRVHLFVARWPEANVDPAWRKSSEIAHYVADRPEGPFRFKQVVLRGTGRRGDWDAYAPRRDD
jgi:arylsulfatase A-like enzyme